MSGWTLIKKKTYKEFKKNKEKQRDYGGEEGLINQV
jgi:hypothetical protein